MHPLLARQLRKHLAAPLPTEPGYQALFAAVSAAYDELESDRRFFEHTLEVTSQELTDANERLRVDAERELASVNRYFQQSLEAQQGMILCAVRQPTGFVHTLCRGQLAARLGWTPERVEGRGLHDILPPVQAGVMQAAYEKAWAGRESRCTVTAPDESLVFLASLRPRSEAGTVCEVVASCIDITELKKRTNELILARDRAEAADQAKTDFLAVISHEIRTPLNSILGYAGLLKDDLVDETHRAWLQSIEECGEALCGIIGDILDFSHMEAGRLQLNPRPVRLQPLVQTIVTMFSPRAAARGIELACDVAPGVPAAVATDGTRLRQVLVNLISNAIKFTPAGRVEVFVRPGRGDPAPGGSLRVVQFAVRDNGVGIPPEKREVLFKPFSQADASPTRQFGGIGLGLVICQRLVHSLGGEIWFTSEPNVGSEFTFEICAPEVSVQPEAGAPEPPEPRPLDFGSALPILVADADPAGRATMEELLELLGCAADFAIDGTEAVRRTASHNYAAVFLDLGLPAPGGLEVARRIRIARQGRSQPRIVGVSSGAVVQQLPRCLDAGMDAVLTKPVAPGAVRNELLRVVSRGFH